LRLIDRVVGDTAKDISEPLKWIDPIYFAGTH